MRWFFEGPALDPYALAPFTAWALASALPLMDAELTATDLRSGTLALVEAALTWVTVLAPKVGTWLARCSRMVEPGAALDLSAMIWRIVGMDQGAV